MEKKASIRKRARDLFFRAAHSLFVCRCIACGEPIASDAVFCDTCEEEFRAARLSECGICARSLSHCLCADTAFSGSVIHKHIKLYRYLSHEPDAIGNRILYRLKSNDVNICFRFLGSELAKCASELLPLDESYVITHLPRTRDRVNECGFDQSERIAKELGYALDLPAFSLLARTGRGKMQKSLSSVTARERNAAASLSLAKNAERRLEGRRVLLVDDIVTSGASMRAAAKLLRAAGAREIIAVSVATVTRTRNLKTEAERNSHLPPYMR